MHVQNKVLNKVLITSTKYSTKHKPKSSLIDDSQSER